MDARQRSHWLFATGTAATFLALQVHFVLAWRTIYAPTGLEPPSFMTSSTSLLVGVITLVVIPLATLWFRRGPRRQALVAMWAGAMVVNLAIVATSKPQGTGVWLGFGVLLMSFVTAVPLVVGALVQAIIQESGKYLRTRSPKQHVAGTDDRAV
jgi:hypothetical protein